MTVDQKIQRLKKAVRKQIREASDVWGRSAAFSNKFLLQDLEKKKDSPGTIELINKLAEFYGF